MGTFQRGSQRGVALRDGTNLFLSISLAKIRAQNLPFSLPPSPSLSEETARHPLGFPTLPFSRTPLPLPFDALRTKPFRETANLTAARSLGGSARRTRGRKPVLSPCQLACSTCMGGGIHSNAKLAPRCSPLRNGPIFGANLGHRVCSLLAVRLLRLTHPVPLLLSPELHPSCFSAPPFKNFAGINQRSKIQI